MVALISSLVMAPLSQLGSGCTLWLRVSHWAHLHDPRHCSSHTLALSAKSLWPQGMCLQSPGYYLDMDIWGAVNSSTAKNAAVDTALCCVSLWVSETGMESCLANRAHQTGARGGETCSLRWCGHGTHQPCIWGDVLDTGCRVTKCPQRCI